MANPDDDRATRIRRSFKRLKDWLTLWTMLIVGGGAIPVGLYLLLMLSGHWARDENSPLFIAGIILGILTSAAICFLGLMVLIYVGMALFFGIGLVVQGVVQGFWFSSWKERFVIVLLTTGALYIVLGDSFFDVVGEVASIAAAVIMVFIALLIML